MTCPQCHQEIPTKKHGAPLLACPRCLAAKSYQDILNLQKAFRERIRTGEIDLRFRKPAGQSWHVAFLRYPDQAWCGTAIEPGWKARLYAPWLKAPRDTCARCREVIEQMLEDRTAEVA